MWDEIAEGVFRKRYEWVDLNVGLVLGGDGALVVDTRTTPAEGAELRADVATLTRLPVRWIVNTHWHWDHVLGNAEFLDAESWGHAACAAHIAEFGEADVASALEWFPAERHGELEGVLPIPPRHTLADTATIDIGGRTVVLRFSGLAHTDSDISIVVPDAGVCFAGDMLESGAPPVFGDGYPLAWPATLARHLDAGSRFVPGHGEVMEHAEAHAQLAELEAVAAVCRQAIAEGASAGAVPDGGPYSAETMQVALSRALLESD
jgi:glyoxylase-like metal-dependent hydrolase (beta-lactamase superfamily II)